MHRKLLDLTLRKYILFSVIVLVISVPLFYFVLGEMYLEETEDSMLFHKEQFIQKNSNHLSEQDIVLWNKMNQEVQLIKIAEPIEGKFRSLYVLDSIDQEYEPYLQLEANVIINGANYKYVERKNLIESEDIIVNIAVVFTIILLLLLLGFILITKRMSIKLWQPFYATLTAIENFEIDKQSDHIFIDSNIEEFNRLNESIHKLIERNGKIFKIQREFVENAAHELQTPLAVFQGKIDNLIQKEGLPEEYYQSLDSLSHSVINIKRLNKNLLLLTSLENNGFELKENVNIIDIYKEKSDFFRDQAVSRNIVIHDTISESATMFGNQMLLDILLSNLIMNAIKHNHDKGEIWIELSKNKIVVKNSGEMSALDKDKIFNRFEKTSGSNSGNGLGLSIVKRIVELNNWTIDYSFENNFHHFSVNS